MSYDRNLYIGWYVTFTNSNELIETGQFTTTRVCERNKNHKHGNSNFCKHCGSKIVKVQKPVFKKTVAPWFIQFEKNHKDLADMIVHGTVEDVKEIFDGSYAICPEFLDHSKSVILAKGHKKIANMNSKNSFIEELSINEKPSDEWISAITKVFGCTDLELKFGFVFEIV